MTSTYRITKVPLNMRSWLSLLTGLQSCGHPDVCELPLAKAKWKDASESVPEVAVEA